MPLSKYLKNSVHFDIIYRTTTPSKNPLSAPFIKKSLLSVSDISSLSRTLSSANTIKVLSSSLSAKPKVQLATSAVNELNIKKGDPLRCSIVISKQATLDFLGAYVLALSSKSQHSAFSANTEQHIVTVPLHNLRDFLPYAFYESCLLGSTNRFKPTVSIFFSAPLKLYSISLLSTFFPYFGSKKKINSFRTILREIEQSG